VDRRAELEAAIDADPYDPRPYAVLADHLQELGDPRGELIALALAGLEREARAHRHAHAELVPEVEDAHLAWRHGFIHTASVLADQAGSLLDHPASRFLTTLAIARTRGLGAAIARLAANRRHALRELELGPAPGRLAVEDEAVVVPADLERLWPAIPRLARLRLLGSAVTFRTIDLPDLVSLELEPAEDAAAMVAAVIAAEWPALERLDLRISMFGPDSPLPRLLRGLLVGTGFPKLRHLGVRGGNLFRDAIVADALLDSTVLPRLRSLDVSNALLDDDAAERLATHPLRLDRIDVSRNQLTTVGIRALSAIAVTVVADHQYWADRDPDLYDY